MPVWLTQILPTLFSTQPLEAAGACTEEEEAELFARLPASKADHMAPVMAPMLRFL